MEEVKISELIEASELLDKDVLEIVQNGVNKKIKVSKITEALVERIKNVEDKLTDTGWIPITMENGATANTSANNKPAYRKIGNVVYVKGVFTYSGNITTAGVNVWSGLPVPICGSPLSIRTSLATATECIVQANTGVLLMRAATQVASSGNIFINGSYLTE